MTKRKRYCFDLDGTLFETDGMDYANARPIKSRVDLVKRLHRQGHHITIDTARNISHTALTRDQLRLHNVPFHNLHVGRKPPADVYVDDRGVSDTEFFGGAP